MKIVNSFRWLLLPAFALVAACGPSWVVVRQANPNPLAGQASFSLEAIDFSQMKIGNPGSITEAEWIAKKKPEEQPKFQAELVASKTEMANRFAQSFAASAGVPVALGAQPGTFVVRPRVVELEPGFNAFVMTAPAVVRMLVSIADPQGQELDAIEVRASRDAGSYAAMIDRLRWVADVLGRQSGRYLASRTAVAK